MYYKDVYILLGLKLIKFFKILIYRIIILVLLFYVYIKRGNFVI